MRLVATTGHFIRFPAWQLKRFEQKIQNTLLRSSTSGRSSKAAGRRKGRGGCTIRIGFCMAMCGPELQVQYQDVSSRRIQMHQLLRTAFANRSRSWISWHMLTLVGHPKCAAPDLRPTAPFKNWSTDVPNSMDSTGVKRESPSTGKGLVHPCTVLRFRFSHFAWSI